MDVAEFVAQMKESRNWAKFVHDNINNIEGHGKRGTILGHCYNLCLKTERAEDAHKILKLFSEETTFTSR